MRLDTWIAMGAESHHTVADMKVKVIEHKENNALEAVQIGQDNLTDNKSCQQKNCSRDLVGKGSETKTT